MNPESEEIMSPYAHCQRCKRVVRVGLRRDITRSGSSVVYQVCEDSDVKHRLTKDGINVSHEQVRRWGFVVEELIAVNNRANVSCQVRNCNEYGVENHHWAPKEIFGKFNAEDWPTGDLCRKHHEEWHKKIAEYQRLNARSGLGLAGVSEDEVTRIF
jgi:hypothetical protein